MAESMEAEFMDIYDYHSEEFDTVIIFLFKKRFLI